MSTGGDAVSVGLDEHAETLDMLLVVIEQRDALAREVEALLLVIEALRAENRRAWAMVRKHEELR